MKELQEFLKDRGLAMTMGSTEQERWHALYEPEVALRYGTPPENQEGDDPENDYEEEGNELAVAPVDRKGPTEMESPAGSNPVNSVSCRTLSPEEFKNRQTEGGLNQQLARLTAEDRRAEA
ncbi:hypothetical protein NDU88_005464 [Pleurodeles waltl]|uniref:Uncharacterized protein n=1 Tax=Pleurodeles waltl TaxID=8319 RepID=A0AAV7WYU7_PLEWA|nr:hypothetical protein NDU88_005464 [Pleurodeles waltl]